MNRTHVATALAMLNFAGLHQGLHAADLQEIVVTATRIPQAGFDLPAAIDAIHPRRVPGSILRSGAAELIGRTPGAVIQDRGTFAQEQQILLRGFGARSQFGVRGIKLLADGIPASTPDGQGGSGLFDLQSAERIEVLRGAFSTLHGNHSGGVVQIFTEEAPSVPTLLLSHASGSLGHQKTGLKLGARSGSVSATVSATRSSIDGYRDWSAATRKQLNAKLDYIASERTNLSVVMNHLAQPDNRDPLGLTAEQMRQDRRQASPAARTFMTRRTLANNQIGAILEHHLEGDHTLRAIAYTGTRSNEQYLAFPGTAATSSGGVSTFSRNFHGTGIRWSHLGNRTISTAGIDYERADDRRRGYVNQAGRKGDLRRNEQNAVSQTGLYAQSEWQSADWLFHAGLRYSEIRFESRDRHITALNPDDSGRVRHSAWTPVAGVLFQATEKINLYANLGRSFETPTFIELAYRPNGQTGLNLHLRPSVSHQAELGIKAQPWSGFTITSALFRIVTRNEIVVDGSLGGRTTYRNATTTERKGLEIGMNVPFRSGWSAMLSANWLDARFRDGFASSSGLIRAGNHIPGVPAWAALAEITWKDADSGWYASVEGRWSSRIHVNDRNTESASGYSITSLSAGVVHETRTWTFEGHARIENLFDRKYVGAVYVNDGNGRYFAPAPKRTASVGFSLATRF